MHPRLPLHQELYLYAHDRHGSPLIHPSSLNLGLAGATLLDLMLTHRVAVCSGRITLHGRDPVGDPVADATLTALARTGGPRDLTAWLRAIAASIYDRTTGALVAAGLLSRTTRRWLRGGNPHYLVTDQTPASVIGARIRWATYGHEYPDPQCAALCGLMAVLRLERALYLDMPAGDLLRRLRDLAAWHYPPATDIVTAVEALVGETAVSVYR